MRNKYNNIKKTIDNITFDSIKESQRYLELKMLLKTKRISDLMLQPSFELQPMFIDRHSVKHRAINYVADFSYYEGGIRIIEDVKGMKTEVYKIKKKLFIYQYVAADLVFKEL